MEEFLKILKKILRSLVSPIIKLSWKRNLDSNYVQSSNRTCLLKAWTNESSSGESLNFVKSLQNIQRNEFPLRITKQRLLEDQPIIKFCKIAKKGLEKSPLDNSTLYN